MYGDICCTVTLLPCYLVSFLLCYLIALSPCYSVPLSPCYPLPLFPCYSVVNFLILVYLLMAKHNFFSFIDAFFFGGGGGGEGVRSWLNGLHYKSVFVQGNY